MKPLPARIRPKQIDQVLGVDSIKQELLLAAQQGTPQSALFWGPPGSGKTTLALLLAKEYGLPLKHLSATVDGIKELRKVIAEGDCTLFVDEIHRWNKSQQDALLPYVEEGRIVLLGATTENPGHYINRALLSRAKLYRLEPLSETNLLSLLERGMKEFPERVASEEALDMIAAWASGDARRALRALEEILVQTEGRVEAEDVKKLLPDMPSYGDKDEHYHLASAFIKSMRGGDADAALYWMARMENSGEDPRFIARRMVIFASEDVGLARSGAAAIIESIASSVERLGEPECWIPLAHGVCYLAQAPKSRAAYDALQRVREAVNHAPHLPIPAKLRQANSITRQWGDGEGYSHADEDGFLPPELEGKKFLR